MTKMYNNKKNRQPFYSIMGMANFEACPSDVGAKKNIDVTGIFIYNIKTQQ